MKTLKINQTVIALALGLTSAFMVQSAFAQTDEIRNSNLFVPDHAVSDQGSDFRSDMPARHTERVISSDGKLTQIGNPQTDLPALKGFAKDMPLLTVLKQITPNGWVVKKNDSDSRPLDVKQLVSWQGGKTWVETLDSLAHDYRLNVLVNWNDRQITLYPSLPGVKKEEVKSGVFELEGNTTSSIAMGDSAGTELPARPTPVPVHKEVKGVIETDLTMPEAPVVKVAPASVVVAPVVAPAPVVVTSWTMDSNKTLKENVIAWGKTAGYRVVWNGEDYPIDQTRTLTGEFDKEQGPIKQLSMDYGPKSQVQQPLSFEFYQNGTLVVENYKFEQGGFPEYNQ